MFLSRDSLFVIHLLCVKTNFLILGFPSMHMQLGDGGCEVAQLMVCAACVLGISVPVQVFLSTHLAWAYRVIP